MAGVQSGHRVLEIGCGWGALAEMATTEFGAALTGVTLSTEQLAFAQQRLERLGTSSRADLRLQDYRDINDGPYDAICSIEMVEAVGREYWPTYFQSVARLLKPGGRACIQSIVIAEDRKSTRLNSSHSQISYAVFCLKKYYDKFFGPCARGGDGDGSAHNDNKYQPAILSARQVLSVFFFYKRGAPELLHLPPPRLFPI